ncbi:MAG: hypothetical protein ACO21N_10105, partial [Candidatus Nanopelagicales bacterium]
MIHRLAAASVCAAGLMIASVLGPAAAAPANDGPRQVVTVSADSSLSTTATLEAWQMRGGQFVRVRGPVEVFVGQDGVGLASARRSRT